MEITDALVTAIVKEILRRLASGELSFSETNEKKAQPPGKTCCGNAGSTCATSLTGNRRKVISETEIRRLCPAAAGSGQTVEIGARDIVTPLAEDYISKMRITVNRAG